MLNQVNEEVTTMDEIMIEGTTRTLYDYAYGYCHHFAIALNERYGAVINVIWGKLDSEWRLVHVYGLKNGKMKDASGDINRSVLDDYKTFFDYEEFKEEALSKDELIEKMVQLGESKEELLEDILHVQSYIDTVHDFYLF